MSYDPSYIQVLSFPEAARKRPGIYIGSTDYRGLFHLAATLANYGCNFALVDLCKYIQLTLSADDFFTIKSDFPPVPVGNYSHKNLNLSREISILELMMTVPHGYFHGPEGITTLGFLHGIGAEVVAALSEWGWVEVCHPEGVYRQEYARGVATTPLKLLTTTVKSEAWNNVFCFKPDPEIFEDAQFNFDSLKRLAWLYAAALKGLRFEVRDYRDGNKTEIAYQFENGILTLLATINQDYTTLPATPLYAAAQIEDTYVEIALQYRTVTEAEARPVWVSLVNAQPIDFNGEHAIGFWDSASRVLSAYARKKGWLATGQKISRQQLGANLAVVINLRHPRPVYYGPTRTQGLVNPDIRIAVRKVVSKMLTAWLKQHEAEAEILVKQLLQTGNSSQNPVTALSLFSEMAH